MVIFNSYLSHYQRVMIVFQITSTLTKADSMFVNTKAAARHRNADSHGFLYYMKWGTAKIPWPWFIIIRRMHCSARCKHNDRCFSALKNPPLAHSPTHIAPGNIHQIVSHLLWPIHYAETRNRDAGETRKEWTALGSQHGPHVKPCKTYHGWMEELLPIYCNFNGRSDDSPISRSVTGARTRSKKAMEAPTHYEMLGSAQIKRHFKVSRLCQLSVPDLWIFMICLKQNACCMLHDDLHLFYVVYLRYVITVSTEMHQVYNSEA